MKFEIHYTLPSGDEESVIIEGDSVEEIRTKADVEVEKRNGVDPWSICLDENQARRNDG